MKACSHCREQKDLAEFPAHRHKRDGLSSWCRTCHAEACARWRAKNTQAIDAYNERRRAEYAEERENAPAAAGRCGGDSASRFGGTANATSAGCHRSAA